MFESMLGYALGMNVTLQAFYRGRKRRVHPRAARRAIYHNFGISFACEYSIRMSSPQTINLLLRGTRGVNMLSVRTERLKISVLSGIWRCESRNPGSKYLMTRHSLRLKN